jgi:hypothetical protein
VDSTDAGNIYPPTWQAQDVPRLRAGNTLYDLLVSSGVYSNRFIQQGEDMGSRLLRKMTRVSFQPQFLFSGGKL